MSTPPIFDTGQSFRGWSRSRPLADALARAEAGVRAQPQEAHARWLLFELLCVLGQWERALKQLQTWAAFSKDFDSTAHVMRGLIKAERQRLEVFAGRAEPATLAAALAAAPPAGEGDEALDARAPAWMAGLADALRLAASGQGGVAEALEASDAARESALAQVRDTQGASNLQPAFHWIADADSRLGPVCEVILIGAYRWLAFDDISSLTKPAPERLLDLVWSQVDIVLRDGTPLKGYMPMRYPVQEGDRDALLMARETVWHDAGRTGVHGRGQKMWMTDAGDMPLLDVRTCRFGLAASTTG